MPQLTKKQEECERPQKPVCKAEDNEKKLFGRFEIDDVILAIVILAILLDDSDDNLLLIALAVVFLTGIL